MHPKYRAYHLWNQQNPHAIFWRGMAAWDSATTELASDLCTQHTSGSVIVSSLHNMLTCTPFCSHTAANTDIVRNSDQQWLMGSNCRRAPPRMVSTGSQGFHSNFAIEYEVLNMLFTVEMYSVERRKPDHAHAQASHAHPSEFKLR